MELELREVTEEDFDWLYNLRVQTMSKYIIESGDVFAEAHQSARVRKEFESIKIVRVNGQDIGMFKVLRQMDKWEIVQIQLLPKYQNLGIGTGLIQSLLTESAAKNVPVFLSVLKVNPAKHLYEKLGFRVVQEKEKSYRMCYYPNALF